MQNESDWGYRRVLPPSATSIKEYFYTDGFLPDYEYYLKAKINRQEFKKYCDTLLLTLHSDSSKYSDDVGNLNTGGIFTDSVAIWWDKKTNQDSLYVWQKGDEWNIARYFNGHVYLYAHEH